MPRTRLEPLGATNAKTLGERSVRQGNHVAKRLPRTGGAYRISAPWKFRLALQTALTTIEACEVSSRLLNRLHRCDRIDDALALVEHLLPFARDGRMRYDKVKFLESAREEILTRRGSTESPKRPLYACQRCGSLLYWLSDFCPSCAFIPIDFDSVLRGLALSTNLFRCVEILVIGRQIRNGTGCPDSMKAWKP